MLNTFNYKLSQSRPSSSLYYAVVPPPRPQRDFSMELPPHRDPNAGVGNMSYGHISGENRNKKKRKNNRKPSTETFNKRERYTPNKSNISIGAEFTIPFGRKNKNVENKAVHLQKESGHTRSMFFDYSNGGQVSFERSASPVFSDPYTLPESGNSRLWFKGLQFTLFDFPDKTSNPAQFEIVSLFHKMITDIRVAANSAMFANITIDNLRKYFKAVSECVIEYYEIDSLMANDTNTYDNLNQGVKTLWDEASTNPQLLETQFRLRRALKGTFLPPKVLSFLVWSSQFYLFDSDNDSRKGVFKFSWGVGLKSFLDGGKNATRKIVASNDIYESYVNELVTNLFVAQSDTKVQAALAKTYPNWEIKELPLSCNRPSYDERALDIFTNCPCLFKDGSKDVSFPTMLESGIAASNPNSVDKVVVPIHQGGTITDNWDIEKRWNFFYIPSLMYAAYVVDAAQKGWKINKTLLDADYITPTKGFTYTNVARSIIVNDTFNLLEPNIHTINEISQKYSNYETDKPGEFIRIVSVPVDTVVTRPTSEGDTSLIVAEAIQHLLV